MLLKNASGISWAESLSNQLLDIRIEEGVIVEVGTELLRRNGESVFDLEGARVAPGLHDHHLHLRALAAVESSVVVGPPEVQTPAEFAHRLRSTSAHLVDGEWLRGVAYHQSVAGDLDRTALDAILPNRPVRIQHASGILWTLNTAALRELEIGDDAPSGAERDEKGQLTGRFWREDEWLGSRLPRTSHDFSSLSYLAASRGITGFTDATPGAGDEELLGLIEAIENRTLLQRVHVMAEVGVAASTSDLVTIGPVKILLDDMTLPEFDELANRISTVHAANRAVAVHCVTRMQSVLTVAVLEQVGVYPGDRIEHGSLLGKETVDAMARLGIALVTQPGFVVTRGDRFLRDVPGPSQGDLWRLGSVIDAGVVVAGSSDAPFGDPDIWLGIQAAVHRRTLNGQELGVAEAIDGPTSVSLFTSAGNDLTHQRTVSPGEVADLCAVEPGSAGYSSGPGPKVRATFVAGRLIYTAP